MASDDIPNDKLFVTKMPDGLDEESVTGMMSSYGTVSFIKIVSKANQPWTSALVRFSTEEEAKYAIECLDGVTPDGCNEALECRYSAHQDGRVTKTQSNWSSGAAGAGWEPQQPAWGGPAPNLGTLRPGGGKGASGAVGFAGARPGRVAAGVGGMVGGAAVFNRVKSEPPPSLRPRGGQEELPNDKIFVTKMPDGLDEDTVRDMMAAYGTVVFTKIVSKETQAWTSALVRFSTEEEAAFAIESLDGAIPDGCDEALEARYSAHQDGRITKQANTWDAGPAFGADLSTGSRTSSRGGAFPVALNFGGGVGPRKAPGVAGVRGLVTGRLGGGVAVLNRAARQPMHAQQHVSSPVLAHKVAANDVPVDKLFVTKMPDGLDEETIESMMSAYGTVSFLKIVSKADQGWTSALVRFSTEEEAAFAVENLDGVIPEGCTEALECRYSTHQDGRITKQANNWDAGPAFGGNFAGAGFAPVRSKVSFGPGFGGGPNLATLRPGRGAGPAVGGSFAGRSIGGMGFPVQRQTQQQLPVRSAPYGGGSVAPTFAGTRGKDEAGEKIFVTKMPEGLDEKTVATMMSSYGIVTFTQIVSKPTQGWTSAIVRYSTQDEALYAIENLNGAVPGGFAEPVECRFASRQGW